MKENQKFPRPQEHLKAASTLYPQAWKQIEMFRASKGKDLPDWPEWCFAPMAASYAVVSGGHTLRPELVPHVSRIAGLAAWRVSQSFYRFDPALYSRLIETKIDKLPVDILFRLPEWCVYVETPDMLWGEMELSGVFAHLEFDINSGRPELRLLLDMAVVTWAILHYILIRTLWVKLWQQ